MWAVVALAGCTATGTDGPGTDDTAAAADTGTAGQDDTAGAAAGDTGDTASAAELASLSGVVVTPDDAPAEGVFVTLCHGVCRYAETGADGTFSFEAEPQAYALHFTQLGKDAPWADILVAVDLAPGETRDIAEPFPMAELASADEQTAAGEVQVADGLWLTLDPDVFELPFGTDVLAPGAGVPSSFPPELPADDVLAVWYLDPFDAHSDPGFSLRATNSWGLAPGEEAVLYVSNYVDYAWIDGGTVTVSDDGTELTGGDIPVLSTVVLALD